MGVTEEQVNMAKAIVEQMRDTPIMNLPINNEHERRAICIKLALETKHAAFSLKDDVNLEQAADNVVTTAKIFEEYITNG